MIAVQPMAVAVLCTMKTFMYLLPFILSGVKTQLARGDGLLESSSAMRQVKTNSPQSIEGVIDI